MKKRHRNKKRSVQIIRLWGHDEADKAVPYLRSVIGSLREHWLAAQSSKRDADRLAARTGPRKRDRLLAEQAAVDNITRAEGRFRDALAELSAIDVFLLDPVQGVALIPFRKEDELAWFVFDQFDEHGLVGWRYHQDALEQRRPFDQLGDAYAGSGETHVATGSGEGE